MALTLEEAAELAKRKRQLLAREGQTGYKRNVEALKARIAQLEAKEQAQ
jgi:hypothetical protein